MPRHPAFIVLVGGLLSGMTGAWAQEPAPNVMPMGFEQGQVWTYRTRPGEESSRLTVCKVETLKETARVVHVHVEGLAIKNAQVEGGLSAMIGHMPFAEDSLRSSVLALESHRTVLPDYAEGYAQWRTAFDAGNAGFFTTSVSEAVTFIEQAMAK